MHDNTAVADFVIIAIEGGPWNERDAGRVTRAAVAGARATTQYMAVTKIEAVDSGLMPEAAPLMNRPVVHRPYDEQPAEPFDEAPAEADDA